MGPGWRKLGDDGRDLCCSVDYLLESAQMLKEVIRIGRTLDGEGEMKVDSKEIWCPGLLQCVIHHLKSNLTLTLVIVCLGHKVAYAHG